MWYNESTNERRTKMNITTKDFEDIKRKYEKETSTLDLVFMLNLQPTMIEQMQGKSTTQMIMNNEVDHNEMLEKVIKQKYGTDIEVKDGKLFRNN